MHDKRIETLIKVQSELFDKAQSYSRIIIGLGYAGFFAVWAGARNYMLSGEVVVSALCMTVSLFFYIAYEVYQMICQARHLKGLAQVAEVPLEGFDSRFEEHKRSVDQMNRRLMKVWFMALALTVIPGLVGALMLINGFVQFLLRQ